MSLKHHILDGHKVVEVSAAKWMAWMEETGENPLARQVQFDRIASKGTLIGISTCFLNIVCGWSGHLEIFETRAFPMSKLFTRYDTWEEAEMGHARCLEMVRSGEFPDE